MQALALQPNIDIPALDLYVPDSQAFLILTAPCDEAGDFLFDYLTNYRRLEGYGFGTIGKKPGNPRVVWIRAQRRSMWFREYLWSAGQVVELIDEVWEEVGASWCEMPAAPLAAPPMPAPVQVVKPPKAALWDEERMADAMGLSGAELHDRLESGLWVYKWTDRIEKWNMDLPVKVLIRNDYLFNEIAQRFNVKNKEKRRVIE